MNLESGQPGQHSPTSPMAVAKMQAQRLQMVTEHLGRFVEQQLQRLEAATRECEQVLSQRAAVQTQREQLQRDRNDWEKLHERRQAEIQQEEDRLIEAWNRLETQQRKLLAGAERPNPQPPATTGVVTPPVTRPAPAPVVAAPPVTGGSGGSLPADKSVFAEANEARPAPQSTVSRDVGFDQFQRLKREIQNHTKRTKNPPQ